MRQRLFPWLRTLYWMVSAAWLVAVGILWWQTGFGRGFPAHVIGLWGAMIALQFAYQWANPTPKPQQWQPNQAFVGAMVIFVCGVGLSVAATVATEADSAMRLVLPALGIVATTALAVTVYHFAQRHEGEIGEARFHTTPERDPTA